MGIIRVTAEELKARANSLRELNSNFQTQINNLESCEQRLAGMWEGEARDAFDNYFKQNKAKFDKFYQVISQYCDAMDQIAAKYQQAEQTNISLAKTV